VEIIPDETFCCDRSLDSTRFQKEFNYHPPAWPVMLNDLKRDVTVERA
jgi:dTDP-4-dehydrorhamnose reductase